MDYEPRMSRTFEECFLFVEDWKDGNVKLVVLGDEIVEKMGLKQRQGLRMETQGTSSVQGVSIWKGNLETVMQAVVAWDPERKRRRREWNSIFEEWLGDGVNIGVDGV